MTTALDAARARLSQAEADFTAAEAELLAVMASIAPIPAIGIVDGILPRRFEALLEGPRPYWELSQAYGAYQRARRLVIKAKSALHMAKLAGVPAAPPARAKQKPKLKKRLPEKMTLAAYLEVAAA